MKKNHCLSALFFCIVAALTPSQSSGITLDELLNRLDPHGKANENLSKVKPASRSECYVCHSPEKAKHLKRGLTYMYCASCHNKTPHSGITEHRGQSLGKLKIGLKGKINCLSCHRPHRAFTKKEQAWLNRQGLNTGSFSSSHQSILSTKKSDANLPKHLTDLPSREPMLIRRCDSCHTKENLR